MTLHILVESNTSAILLLKSLRPEQESGLIEIRASAPPSSLYSAARTLLAVRNEPVALVLDADSTDPEAAQRRRQDAEEVIGATALAAPLRILVAVPALEALLFLRPAAIARAFPTATEDLLTLGRLSPRDALTRIAPDHDGPHAAIELIRTLDAQDITTIRAEPPLRDLLIFLDELRNASVAAAGLAGS